MSCHSPIDCSYVVARPAPLLTGHIADAIQGSTPTCSRYPTSPSPFSFSSSLSIAHSLAQVTHHPIRAGRDHKSPCISLPCCATTAARGELVMSQFHQCQDVLLHKPSHAPCMTEERAVRADFVMKENFDNAKGRRVAAHSQKKRLSGQAEVSRNAVLASIVRLLGVMKPGGQK